MRARLGFDFCQRAGSRRIRPRTENIDCAHSVLGLLNRLRLSVSQLLTCSSKLVVRSLSESQPPSRASINISAPRSSWWILGLVLVFIPSTVSAQRFLSSSESLEPTHSGGSEVLLEGWTQFSNVWMLLDMSIVLLLALALGAVIAYHPSTRRRVSSLEHLEQPKTFLMYAMVAAVVALLVKFRPEMAIVVFGIGGLMRFRTMVGEAKDTGRVILVTVVGLCCGLKIFIVAIPATVIGWTLIYFLEKQVAGIIRVSGVGEETLQTAVSAYRKLIEKSGCTIIGEQSKFNKKQFLFVLKVGSDFDRESLAVEFSQLPGELRGKVDWEHL